MSLDCLMKLCQRESGVVSPRWPYEYILMILLPVLSWKAEAVSVWMWSRNFWMESLHTMLTFLSAFSAPYEARQPLVQPEGSSSGGPGTKPLRHQASLIRVSDDAGLCQWDSTVKLWTSGTWLFDGPFFSLKGRYETAPSCRYCMSSLVACINS